MRVFAAVGMVLLGGCSLLVSTSDLDTGPSDAGTGGTAPTDDQTAPPASSSSSSSGSSGSTSSTTSSGGDGGTARVPAGLIGAWLFDDGTGNDSSGNKHDGVLEGNAGFGMTDRGNALKLTGNGSLRVPGLAGEAFPKSGTISLWFKYNSMDPSVEHGIFDSWSDTREHIFIRHPNGAPVGSMQVVFQENDFYEWEHKFQLAVDTWAHVVLSWDREERAGRLFVNGALLSDDRITGTVFLPSTQEVRFGKGLDGWIDDVRLFDQVLDDPEIANLP